MKKMPRWLNQEVEIVTVTREALDVDVSYYDHGAHLLALSLTLFFCPDFLKPFEVAFGRIPGFVGTV